MKKILYIIIVTVLISACNETDYLLYDTDQTDGIYIKYINQGEGWKDSMYVNFGFPQPNEITVDVPVKLMGIPKEYGRAFEITTNNSKYDSVFYLNGTDTIHLEPAVEDYFNLPTSFELPPNEVEVDIPLTLKRHADLENKRVAVVINIHPTDELLIRGNDEFVIVFDDMEPEVPFWWPYNLGDYSKEKAVKFFEFFHALESDELNSNTYNVIVDKWDYWLDHRRDHNDRGPYQGYEVFFKKYVITPLWEYSEANPELEWVIPEPIY